MDDAYNVHPMVIEKIYSTSCNFDAKFVKYFDNWVRTCDPSCLVNLQKFELDIFHHIILSKNDFLSPEVTEKLRKHIDICQNVKLPYLHLAAMVGYGANKKFTKELCEKISPLKKAENLDWWHMIENFMLSIEFKDLVVSSLGQEWFDHLSKRFYLISNAITQSKKDTFSAVDVAGICNDREYLQIFLAKNRVSKKSLVDFGSLGSALDCNSPYAFMALAGDYTEENIYKLFATKVQELDVISARKIVRTKLVNPTKKRPGPNPYHVACSSRKEHIGLDDMVSLLLKEGFDVNDHHRPIYYPLYSMLASFVCERDFNPKKVPVYHIRSLKMMLAAGADPNFDEVRSMESENKDIYKFNSVTNRDISSSVLDCYFHCLQYHERWDPFLMEQLDQICLLLLENGADPCYTDMKFGSPLHSLMWLSASHHAQGHLSADFFSMSRMLLYFGADPDHWARKEQCYPIQFYFSRIFTLMGGIIAYDRWIKSEVVTQIAGLLTYMNLDDAGAAFNSISEEVNNALATEDGVNNEVALYIKDSLLEYLTPVRSLQDFCKLALWRGVGRNVNNIKQLDLPRRLLREITSFFALEI